LADILSTFSRLNWISLIDIFLVALVFYGLLWLIQGTQAVQLLRGMIFLVLAGVLITSIVPLVAFKWLVVASIPAFLVSIPVIFQPELRRALERLGRTGQILARPSHEALTAQVINDMCLACRRMASRRHGALIVLERETGLQEYIDTGVTIQGKISSQLLETIFFPSTALHDGAVIIRGDRIVAAACVLPLTESVLPDSHLGTRHRAGVGVTEQSDAISVIVSEETGIISVAHNGRMIRRLDERRLAKVLGAFYTLPNESAASRWLAWYQPWRELFGLKEHYPPPDQDEQSGDKREF
jgi:diadenylate cyclase